MFNDIVASLNHKKMLVVGDLMMDKYYYGQCFRLSPEAPVPVVLVDSEQERLGGACNVALNLRSMNCETWISGIIGDDRDGHNCLDMLSDNNINMSAVVSLPDVSTICKTRVVGNEQHLIRFDKEKKFSSTMEMQSRLNSLDIDFDGIVISDYAKGTIDAQLIGTLRSLYPSAKIFIDPKPPNAKLYSAARAYCLTPNLSEAKMMFSGNADSTEDLAGKLRNQFNSETLLITLSENGVLLADGDKNTRFEAHAIRKKDIDRPHRRDVVGAGDTLIAVFSALSCCGCSKKLSTYIANIAAAIVVNKFGTQTFTLEELQEEINHVQTMVAELF